MLIRRLCPLLLTLALVSPAHAAPEPGCRELAKKLADLTQEQCEAAALGASGARSVNGVPLYQRDVLPAVVEDLLDTPAKPALKVLVLGGIHGDEMSSATLAFRWLNLAVENPAAVNWRFVPVVNPDGLLKTKPSRTNARSVDLNRNFPTQGWAQQAQSHWVQRTQRDPRRWPGPQAKSEPETRFIVETIEQWKPDLIVSIHAPYAVLDFDGPHLPPQKLGRLFLDRVGVFPGSLGAYGGLNLGVPVVTLELPHATRIPNDSDVRMMWDDLLRWVDERLVVASSEPAGRSLPAR